jgi:arylsulfatase A-like enzyme
MGCPLRRCAILAVVVAGISSDCRVVQADQPARPNIVLMMADDQGWGDVGYRGHKVLQTPHLDRMAAEGVRLDRFYAAAPVCSPTRGSMLTGRHPFRYGIFGANVGHVPPAEVTIAELLSRAGYRTGHFGKWHLGTLTTTVVESNRGGPRGAKNYSIPSQNGFQKWFSTEAKVPTWDPLLRPKGERSRTWWKPVSELRQSNFYGTNYWEDGERVTADLRGDDSRIIMDRAVPFIKAAAKNDQPFLAVIWFHAPHLPVVTGKSYSDRYPTVDGYHQSYYGCLTAMDEQVGRLRKALDDAGVREETLVWYCADNGPEGKATAPGTAAGLRGRKRSLYEGGIRVPGIVCWPGEFKAGSRSVVPCSTSDILPTVAGLLGIDLEVELDGLDISGVLAGVTRQRTTPIGFETRGQVAWIDNDLKLIARVEGPPSSVGELLDTELYNLRRDTGEKVNLSEQLAEQAIAMTKALQQWRHSVRKSLAIYSANN